MRRAAGRAHNEPGGSGGLEAWRLLGRAAGCRARRWLVTASPKTSTASRSCRMSRTSALEQFGALNKFLPLGRRGRHCARVRFPATVRCPKHS